MAQPKKMLFSLKLTKILKMYCELAMRPCFLNNYCKFLRACVIETGYLCANTLRRILFLSMHMSKSSNISTFLYWLFNPLRNSSNMLKERKGGGGEVIKHENKAKTIQRF